MKDIKVDGGGLKNDIADGKNRLELIPPNFIEGVGKVLTHGALKYGAYNWLRGITYNRLLGAIKRHILAIEKGEDKDSSGQLHAYHAACGLAFLSYYQENSDIFSNFDDRIYQSGLEEEKEKRKSNE